ncbi:MAG: putative aminohydrolase SsnA [Thermoanaerobaculaceae bacterium]
MSTLLIANGTVVTLGANPRVLHGHDVVCEGGRVARIAPHSASGAAGARTIDATGKVVLPGLINAHTHLYSTLVRGLGKAAPSATFREVLEHLWWRLDRQLTLEDCRVSAEVALIEAIRHGTTTLVDHHASPHAVRGSLDVIADAVGRAGVRACLCYEVSDRDGAGVSRAGIAENAAFIERCRGTRDDTLRALFGLHAAFTLSDATLERVAAEARDLGAGVHLHVAEAASDKEHSVREHGVRVVERLHRFGVLGPGSIAAHCVHVDAREIALLAETGTAVVHNPQSNMNNAVGVADVPAMLAKGVLVGLGTDAMTTDMLEELRAALFVRHLAAKNPSAGFLETTSLLTAGNPAIVERLWPGLGLGELREGGAADLAVFDYDPPTPFDETTMLGHLVFGLSQASVDSTVVGGKVLMAGGALEIDLDEREVMARARERARVLWERF